MPMIWRLCALLACCCAVATLAQSPADQTLLSPRPPRVRDRDIGKPDEPSCDQLKAMWRFSKRQARAPEILNEVSSYRDPFMYNEWPAYTSLPRAAPRFRYQYPSMSREPAYGRVVTKAPPNVVRSPDLDDESMHVYGVLHAPHATGKMLRYPGPAARVRTGPAFMVPPQRNRFEVLKKLIREEHLRDAQRQFEYKSKHGLKDVTAGRHLPNGDDLAYGYTVTEPHQPPPDYVSDEPAAAPRTNKKPGRQAAQFSRYSDAYMPPVRRSFYHPYYEFAAPEYYPYAY